MKKANYCGYIRHRLSSSKLFLIGIVVVFSILFGMFAFYQKNYEGCQTLFDVFIHRTNSMYGVWNHLVFVMFYLTLWFLVVHHISRIIQSPQLILAARKKTTLFSIKIFLFLFLSICWVVITNLIAIGVYLLICGLPIFAPGQVSTFLLLSLFKVLTFFGIACLIHKASYFMKNISVVFIVMQGFLLIESEIFGVTTSVLWISQVELPLLWKKLIILLIIDCVIVVLGYVAESLTDPEVTK